MLVLQNKVPDKSVSVVLLAGGVGKRMGVSLELNPGLVICGKDSLLGKDSKAVYRIERPSDGDV